MEIDASKASSRALDARPRSLAAKRSISFVVPCFNEEENIADTVSSIRTAMGANEYEIILVDDCSSDGTLARMHELARHDSRIVVLHNPVNLNFGGAYKRGLFVAQAEYAMMLPGDNGFPAESIFEIARHAGEADIIIPTIINQGARPWYRTVGSRGFTLLLNWLFWLEIGYYNGAVLQRIELLRKIEIKTGSFAYQAEALVKLTARGASYKHCQVRINEREAGQSSALSWRNQKAVLLAILHLLIDVGPFRMRRAT
jgi:glycosyltransferase involved in cell wall biosynthesis